MTDRQHTLDLLISRYDKSPIKDTKQSIYLEYPYIKYYTRYYDDSVNYSLRHKRISNLNYNIVRDIWLALEDVEHFTEEVILFRGVVNTPKFPIKDMKIGTIIENLGFSSKSSTVEPAFNFTSASPDCCLMIVKYPKGSKHLKLSPISFFKNEDEFLTYPGEKFIIKNSTQINEDIFNVCVIDVDFIGYSYTGLQDIQQTIDTSIDITYWYFRCKVCDNVYFEDTRTIITYLPIYKPELCTALELHNIYVIYREDFIYEAEFHSPYLETSYEDYVEDRIYTWYTSNKTNNVYLLPDLHLMGNKVSRIIRYIKGKNPEYKRIKVV